MKEKIKVAASILSADFANLKDDIKKIEISKADSIHIDIMDGHFVPNITMGPKMVAAINRSTDLFLDVHLMIYNPFDYIDKFIESGADLITFHTEATEDVEDTIQFIKKCGKKVGLSINPKTSFSMVEKFLDHIDLVLFMSVNPGFGGQKFIPSVLDKIKSAKKLKADLKLNFDIQVDGGINDQTAKDCIKAGANYLVSGTYLFSQKDMTKAVQSLKEV